MHVLAGTPPGAWRLAGSWSYSETVAEVIFTGLGQYQELAVFEKGVTLSASGLRFWEPSADGGSTWLFGNNVYTYFGSDGTTADLYFGTIHFTASASARGGDFRIVPWNVAGAKKVIVGNINYIVEDTAAYNALRFFAMQSDYTTPCNLTAGEIAVWGRLR